ncbi:MAG TPA: pilus assembly protein PilM, partial [Gaiellaceae bacterium]|nr:pilus assembly protein PilM [Gaiellaceae bacterium]
MTTWNENDHEQHDGAPADSPGENWEQGETHELSTREVSFRRREPSVEPTVQEDHVALPAEPSGLPTGFPVEEPVAPASPAEQKVPFYKREISLGRKKERAATVVAAATVAPPAPTTDSPSETPVVDVGVGGGAALPVSAPVPSVRARRNGGSGSGGGTAVGVKISQSAISAAVIEQRDGVGELTALVRRPLDPGIVVDGEVASQPGLAAALEALWAEAKLPRRGIRLGLFGSRVGVRPVDIVGIDEDERFANAVRFKAHEVLPIGVQESVLDYRVLSERMLESGEHVRRTLLVVAPRDQVMPYVEAFRTARIGLEAVDIDALALMRAFVDPGQPGVTVAQDSAAVVVSMDRD